MNANHVAGILAAACSAVVANTAAADTGIVAGRIKYGNGAATPALIKPTKDPAVCGQTPLVDESLLVGKNGGLANVVVSIDGAANAPSTPDAVARVDQRGCRYVPHVQTAPAGARLEITNSDSVLHNIHAYGDGRTLFNWAMPVPNQKLGRKLDKTGVVDLKCDAGHTWMRGYVVVTPSALAAVSGPDGTFRIANVPPGTYQVKIWHEKLGEKSASVKVAPGAEARVDLVW